MPELTDFRVNYSLMDKPVLTVSIQLSDDDPVEVIVEKIKASLPKPMRSFKEERQHPFDGPEVFDDTPHGEVPHDSVRFSLPADHPAGRGRVGGPIDGQIFIHEGVCEIPSKSIEDDYPRLKELFEAKRAEVRSQRPAEGEGEWLLNSDDNNIGEDCE